MVFVNEYTADNTEFAALLRRDGRPDFRMRDVELLVRHFAFTRFLPRYTGNLKDLLDLTCKELNHEMIESEASVRDQAEQCLEGIRAVTRIFGADAFRRWNRNSYERPFNRALSLTP